MVLRPLRTSDCNTPTSGCNTPQKALGILGSESVRKFSSSDEKSLLANHVKTIRNTWVLMTVLQPEVAMLQPEVATYQKPLGILDSGSAQLFPSISQKHFSRTMQKPLRILGSETAANFRLQHSNFRMQYPQKSIRETWF